MSFMYRRADILPMPRSLAGRLPYRPALLNAYNPRPASRLPDALDCVLLLITAGLLSLLLSCVAAGAF